jgi:hypothetical protein
MNTDPRSWVLQGLVTPLALALFLLVATAPASAQSGGNITVYADPAGSLCSIADQSPGQFSVFVLHTNMTGMFTADLRVFEGAGFTASFVSENIPFVHIGTFRDGVSIAYGLCSEGSLLLGTITYLGNGTSAPCSIVNTTGNPNFPGAPTAYPVTQTCYFELLPAPSTTALHVNPTTECQQSCAVATQPSTWGNVKALYRD